MQAMTHSMVLRTKQPLMTLSLGDAFARFWGHPEPARVVPLLLLQLHQIMRASVPLLEAAQRRAHERAAEDPVCAGLCAYYQQHVEEERFHDEWMLEDLAAAGIGPAEALAKIPSPHLAAAVGAQYYWVLHHHPVALLGYMAVLEGHPPPADLLDEIQARSGLPPAALRTLRKHGQLDPDHGRELDRQLDALPLTPAHTTLMGLSMAHTASSLASALEELLPPA
jgi:hypothetical protein